MTKKVLKPKAPLNLRERADAGGFLSVTEILELTGLSRSTLWRMQRDRRFPQSVQLSQNRIAWRALDFLNWSERGAARSPKS